MKKIKIKKLNNNKNPKNQKKILKIENKKKANFNNKYP